MWVTQDQSPTLRDVVNLLLENVILSDDTDDK